MSPNNNTKTGPTALNSDLFISPPMNKYDGAGLPSLTTAAASCHHPNSRVAAHFFPKSRL
jgi:hypothetical protein